jgi:cell wall-associated NlpC family hydrolase
MAIATPELAPAPNVTFAFADLVGKPFKWCGRGPDAFDCYGVVEETARRAGLKVPDYNSPTVHQHIASLIEEQVSFWTPCHPGPGAVATIRVRSMQEGQMRSLVSHVAMLLPHGRMIHAWEASGGVTVERVADWQHRITGFYRFPQ